jgi:hypothetical protein
MILMFRTGKVLKPLQRCDWLRFTVLVVCCHTLMYLDPSRLYHSIRGQAMIKLYVIFNVLEVSFDNVVCNKLALFYYDR